tara:strand:- start:3200 stop:3541 length:342 start_codon:yes stop_codon:yes gene_type:complete
MLKMIVFIGFALAFYTITILAYYFNTNFLIKDTDFRKFIVGPFVIFFVMGLLRSKLLGRDEWSEKRILFNGILLSLMFICYYGFTKIISNKILLVNNIMMDNQITYDSDIISK